MKPIKSTLLSLLLLYSAHTVYAEDWDGKSPIWLSAQSDKLRFSIWDKQSVYDKYDITYMVGLKGGRPDYFIAKRSHMKGESPELSQVVFPVILRTVLYGNHPVITKWYNKVLVFNTS